MTVAENRERGHDVEAAACDRWPLDRVDDDRAEWYDLEFIADIVGDLADTIATAGDVVEARSCYEAYDGRAGRWWLRRENHERLVDVGGWYALVVLEARVGRDPTDGADQRRDRRSNYRRELVGLRERRPQRRAVPAAPIDFRRNNRPTAQLSVVEQV